MNQAILDYLKKERICCVSVIISENTPHTATVHFSHQSDPLRIFIQTSNTTVKAQPFLKGESGKSAITVGFSEEKWLTLQMRGAVRMVSNSEELEEIYKIHYAKHPEAEQYKGPKTVFLEFTPTWWRYTDFNTDPETIIEK